MPPTLMWFRRDLRLVDNPALCAAIAEAEGDATHPVFVLDPRLLGPAGAARNAFLAGCVDALDDALGGRLTIVAGDPVEVIPRLAERTGAEADRRFAAWADGMTGYPIVDAGMRQLKAEAWMHNRVRMIVASFLVKDLHVDWRRGARHFMRLLVDGDLANNQHGWQWVAGTGTDPAPFFRIFNPVLQGEKFDPGGDYVRRFVPELDGVAGKAVHQPWKVPDGPPKGYPDRIVDHAVERRVALARWDALR